MPSRPRAARRGGRTRHNKRDAAACATAIPTANSPAYGAYEVSSSGYDAPKYSPAFRARIASSRAVRRSTRRQNGHVANSAYDAVSNPSGVYPDWPCQIAYASQKSGEGSGYTVAAEARSDGAQGQMPRQGPSRRAPRWSQERWARGPPRRRRRRGSGSREQRVHPRGRRPRRAGARGPGSGTGRRFRATESAPASAIGELPRRQQQRIAQDEPRLIRCCPAAEVSQNRRPAPSSATAGALVAHGEEPRRGGRQRHQGEARPLAEGDGTGRTPPRWKDRRTRRPPQPAPARKRDARGGRSPSPAAERRRAGTPARARRVPVR